MFNPGTVKVCKSGELLKECSGLKWVLHFPVFIEKQSTCFKVAQLEKREPQLGDSSGVAKEDFRENSYGFWATL